MMTQFQAVLAPQTTTHFMKINKPIETYSEILYFDGAFEKLGILVAPTA
jgi:hypothetical protein